MLDFDYPKRYADLVSRISWDIELPSRWNTFFTDSGIAATCPFEQRAKQRRVVRLRGLMCIDRPLASIPRERQWFGVYTKDFSQDSCGAVAPLQLFPEEQVRLVLSTFWLTLKVVRARRETPTCFDTGFTLLYRHDPDRTAFILGGNFLQV